MIKFTLEIKPRTKKNHGQIIHSKTGRHILLPSKPYREFEKEAVKQITNLFGNIEPIDFRCNVKCVFYKDTHCRSDLPGYMQAILDAMVKAELLKDDNSEIVYSTNGSYVDYDKQNPRIEVEIEALDKTDVF